MKSRIAWIDNCRGLAIIMVILGHILMRTGIYNIEYLGVYAIYSFHMPLFFVIAGMTLNIKGTFREWTLKKAKALLIPAIIFSAMALVFNFLFIVFTENIDNAFKYLEGLCSLKSVIYTIFLTNKSAFSGYWFFPVLFSAYIIFFWIEKIDSRIIRLSIIVFLIIANRIITFFGIALPIGGGEAFLAIPFLVLGKNISKIKKEKNAFICLIIWILGFVLWNRQGYLVADFFNSNIYNIFLFFLMAMSASTAIVLGMKGIYERFPNIFGWLGKLGKQSMYIYGIHYFFLEIWVKIVQVIGVSNVFYKLCWDIIGSVLIVSVCYILVCGYKSMKYKMVV